LYLAEKYLDEETYTRWNEASKLAKLEVIDREEKVANIDA
jgi:hypothetical protein